MLLYIHIVYDQGTLLRSWSALVKSKRNGALVFLFEPFDHLGLTGIAALLGAYSGIYLFRRGFLMLQHKRLIQNTPFSKIRSASMGLVEVSGMARGPQTIRAGITGEPCYYYRARAWQQSESGNKGEWQQVADETVGIPFFVDDGTGRMLIYPQGARLDVHRNFTEEYGGSIFASRDLLPESVHKFLALHGIFPSGMIRLEQHCILPGFPLFVFGTLGENPEKNPWPPALQAGVPPTSPSMPGNPVPSFPRSGAPSSSSIVTTVTTKHAFTVAGLVNVSRSVVTMPAQMAPPEPGGRVSQSGPANRAAHSPADRNTHEADAEEFDPHTRAAITQGDRNQFFTISSESQREVVSSLEWKAIACIWGGPILALLFIYLLIVSWDWS
jgi:hypothetical protein